MVTGGNRGIGRAIVEALVANGLHVAIAARDPKAGRAAAAEIGCTVLKLDLEHPESWDDALAGSGTIHILINNAGVLWKRPMLEHPEDFAKSMQVMVKGPYGLSRCVVPGMIEAGFGRIVNVSSGWGSFTEGLGGPGAYGVAKAALNALTLAMAREVPKTVKVNAMCPGWVRTRMGGVSATRSPEEGAKTADWLATLPEDGPTGKFFRDRKEIPW
jgi:NAD(P)-dependent dehydrogenase (short-subunit alcohol dehydrogenase family)